MKNKHIQAFFKSSKKPLFATSSRKINKTPFLIISTFVGLSLLYAFSVPSDDTIKKHKNRQLEIPSSPLLNFTAQTPENEINWQEIVIKKGQTLSSIFDDLNLSQTLLYNIIHINKDAKLLTKIFPGAILAFSLSTDGSFSQLKYKISESQELFIKQIDEKLSSTIVLHQTGIQVQTANGTITGSLFNAGKKAY